MSDFRKVKLYDTYTSKKVELKPIAPPEVDIYYCGPTVYNYAHIGNVRPVLVFDLLARVLDEVGYDVKIVSNYTDIDDKIINKAIEEKVDEKEISTRYIESYQEDILDKLHVFKFYNQPRVSEYIPEIENFIDKMISTDHAYVVDGDVFFRVGSVDHYGELSKMKIDDLISGARIEKDTKKESSLDFALWKKTEKGIKFDAEFGLGRPGWHTECLVMINKVFHKPLIDIHGGGFDLKFPHHENEIAQSRALNGSQLANIWMHVGFLNMGEEKMSKSTGNVIWGKDAIAKFGANTVRLFFLSTRYQAPISFTDEALENASKSLAKYQEVLDRLQTKLFISKYKKEGIIQEYYEEFMDSLCDDLNVANAMVAIEKLCKHSNSEIRKKDVDLEQISLSFFTLQKMFAILGLRLEERVFTDEDEKIYSDYLEAKSSKDFEKSDVLRKKMLERHFLA